MAKIVSRGDPIEPVYLNNLIVASHGWGVHSGLVVSQRGAGANMSVDIAAGYAWINEAIITKGSITNAAITAAHASYDRYDIVVINSSGTISVIDGTAAAITYANDYDLETNNAILLAEVYVPATDTTIEDAQITDKQIISFAEEIIDSSAKIINSFYAGLLKEYTLSSDVLHSHDASVNTTSTTYTKLKTITIDTLFTTPSTIRISFKLWTSEASETAYGRIYKNGGAVGTERTRTGSGSETFTEDLSFAQGDTVELYLKTSNGSWNANAMEFRILGAETDILLADAIVASAIGLADPFAATSS